MGLPRWIDPERARFDDRARQYRPRRFPD